MKKKYRPFTKLEEKKINKNKIIRNTMYSIMFITATIFILSYISSDIREINKSTKDAQHCKVVLTKDIGFAVFNDSNEVLQIVSTGEYVNIHPVLRTDLLFRVHNYFLLDKEYDAVWFYYQGQKTVHLRYFFLIYYFVFISFSVQCAILGISIAIITYKRVKYADTLRNKKLTKKQKDRVRHVILISFLVLLIILVFIIDWRYLMIYQALFYTMLITSIIVKLAQEDYYIDLPAEEDTQ